MQSYTVSTLVFWYYLVLCYLPVIYLICFLLLVSNCQYFVCFLNSYNIFHYSHSIATVYYNKGFLIWFRAKLFSSLLFTIIFVCVYVVCVRACVVCMLVYKFLMPSWNCVNVLPVYYTVRMVNENTTTVVSSQFLNKGYHSACFLFSLCSLLFRPMPPIVDYPDRSWKMKTNAVLHKWLLWLCFAKGQNDLVVIYTR